MSAINVTLQSVNGGNQAFTLEDGHYKPDTNGVVWSFAVKLQNGTYKEFALHPKHLPPPQTNYIRAAKSAGAGAVAGAAKNIQWAAPGMLKGGAVGAVLLFAADLGIQHFQSHQKPAQAREEWVYLDDSNQAYFVGPLRVSV